MFLISANNRFLYISRLATITGNGNGKSSRLKHSRRYSTIKTLKFSITKPKSITDRVFSSLMMMKKKKEGKERKSKINEDNASSSKVKTGCFPVGLKPFRLHFLSQESRIYFVSKFPFLFRFLSFFPFSFFF